MFCAIQKTYERSRLMKNQTLRIITFTCLAAVFPAVILYLFLKKRKHKAKETEGTPDSAVYVLFFKLVDLVRRHKMHLSIDNEKLKDIRGPFILLSNHISFFDFYYIRRLLTGMNPAFVVNRHYVSFPVVRWMAKKSGFIPKRVFHTDLATPIKIYRTLKTGYPVVIFPEGRLSITGASYPILEEGAAFYKKMGVDIVLAKISGAYLAGPKWRKRFYKTDIRVAAERIITAEEAKGMTDEALNRLISDTLYHNEYTAPLTTYPQKDKAQGISDVLYRCIDCGSLYTTKGVGNDLVCTACHSVHHLNEQYRFDGEPATIADYYARIQELEKKELPDLSLETPVKVVIFHDKKPFRTTDKGVCTLTKEAFFFRSEKEEFTIGLDHLMGLPFSCHKQFELYHGDDLYYFYPEKDPQQVVRWALIVDLIREVRHETA